MDIFQEIEERLLTPSQRLVEDMKNIKGDILVLGAGGKMGPSLCILAARAVAQADMDKKIYAVSRFSDEKSRKKLEDAGVHTISMDILTGDLSKLPDCENLIYMAGKKFGTNGAECETWAMNAYLPGRVCERYPNANIVAFSTGNVYPYVEVSTGGATEDVTPGPIGEYAQSCLGRERIFEYFSRKFGTKVCMYRLNYAVDMRYGVIMDIGRAVAKGEELDITMGHTNAIFQGDANEYAIRCLLHCKAPINYMNITGEQIVVVKDVVEKFEKLLGCKAKITGTPAEKVQLMNPSKAFALMGKPQVDLDTMIQWGAEWIRQGGEDIGKPTHFNERGGKF